MGVKDSHQNYNDNNKDLVSCFFKNDNNKDILKGFHWCQ